MTTAIKTLKTSADDDLMNHVDWTHRRLKLLVSPEGEDELELAGIARKNRCGRLKRLFTRQPKFKVQHGLELKLINFGVRYRCELGSLILEQDRFKDIRDLKAELDELPGSRLLTLEFRFMARRYLRLYQRSVDEIWGQIHQDKVRRI